VGLVLDAESHPAPLYTKAQIDEVATLAAKRERRALTTLLKAAAPHGPIVPSDVLTLPRDSVSFDDKGSMVVLGDKGPPRYSASGVYLTVSEYMTEFARANANLFAGQSMPSAGRHGRAQEARSLSAVD
jgi:hypothetical protein